jgi:hypothetical protein
MNDHEKRAFLIRRLQGEMPMYKKLPVPDGGTSSGRCCGH